MLSDLPHIVTQNMAFYDAKHGLLNGNIQPFAVIIQL